VNFHYECYDVCVCVCVCVWMNTVDSIHCILCMCIVVVIIIVVVGSAVVFIIGC
jgi:hypothetical protein